MKFFDVFVLLRAKILEVGFAPCGDALFDSGWALTKSNRFARF